MSMAKLSNDSQRQKTIDLRLFAAVVPKAREFVAANCKEDA